MPKNHHKSGDARVHSGDAVETQVADVLAPNNIILLTIPTVLAAGSWLAVQSIIDTPVGHKARGRIYIYIHIHILRLFTAFVSVSVRSASA